MKTHETDLTSLPGKTFYQGVIGDENYEQPINIVYYNDCISLEQYPNGCVLVPYQAFVWKVILRRSLGRL